MKKTKILATFGPAIASPGIIKRLIQSGVNVFRVNCSHGRSEDFLKAANMIRTAAKSSGSFPVGLLFDISGPKLRLGRFKGEISVKAGQEITLVATDSKISKRIINVNFPDMIKSARPGDKLFIDDGILGFEIISVRGGRLVARSLNSGTILPGKGINIPRSKVKIPLLNDKDIADIKVAVRVDADYIGLSFVRTADDIKEAKKVLKRFGGRQRIIAKLEKAEAIENLEEIIKLADGVMIARGDLGVELPPQEIPHLQKKIIAIANRFHKPVIVATQMLESMRFSPRATRAEINDVASAVFDSVDAVMLSAETASGKYPLEAVRTMKDVIDATERSTFDAPIQTVDNRIGSDISHAIAGAVTTIDRNCNIKLIFAFTTGGFTAEMISNLFPAQPIIALTPDAKVSSRLAFYRSVYSVTITQPKSFNDMLSTVRSVCSKYKLARKGDSVIITGGAPFGSTVPTNFAMIYKIEGR